MITHYTIIQAPTIVELIQEVNDIYQNDSYIDVQCVGSIVINSGVLKNSPDRYIQAMIYSFKTDAYINPNQWPSKMKQTQSPIYNDNNFV